MNNIKKITLVERIILRTLIESEDHLSAPLFWSKYRITPMQLVKSLERFVRHDIVIIDGSIIKLTEEGRIWAIKYRNDILAYKDKQWRKCPEEFEQPKLPVNKPYVPLTTLLDKEFRIKK